MIPGSAQTLSEVRWRFTDPYAKPIPEDERMRKFAERYARNFERKCGSPPHGYHPFPNYWDTKFLIEYCGPGGFDDERYRRFQEEQNSGSQTCSTAGAEST